MYIYNQHYSCVVAITNKIIMEKRTIIPVYDTMETYIDNHYK